MSVPNSRSSNGRKLMIDRCLSARDDMVIAYRELKKSTTVEFVLYHASLTIATKAVLFIGEDIISVPIYFKAYELVLIEY